MSDKNIQPVKLQVISLYIKKVTRAVKNLNGHLYFFTSPLVQKQALFGTLIDKVYDFFMDRIVTPSSM